MSDERDDRFKVLGEDEWFGAGDEPQYWISGSEQGGGCERRVEKRARVHIGVHIQPGGRPATAGDLGVGGALIYTDDPGLPGSQLDLTMETDSGMAQAKGVVRWVSKGSMHDITSDRICMGVQFTWVEMAMRQLLDR